MKVKDHLVKCLALTNLRCGITTRALGISTTHTRWDNQCSLTRGESEAVHEIRFGSPVDGASIIGHPVSMADVTRRNSVSM